MALRESNGLGQFLDCGKLTSIHAPPLTLSLIKFQGPRTLVLEPGL
jgi:hypothetical protein